MTSMAEATDELRAAFLQWLDALEITANATDAQVIQLAAAAGEWWAAVESVAESAGVVFV